MNHLLAKWIGKVCLDLIQVAETILWSGQSLDLTGTGCPRLANNDAVIGFIVVLSAWRRNKTSANLVDVVDTI